MHIKRIQVEEGFLNGLDLELPSGLIAVIGERGTGKTSLIEIIRYGLGARNYTTESTQESLQHARSILDGGEVTVTIEDFLDDIVVSRSGEDEAPRFTETFTAPIIFSQKEIETVALSDAGRLGLVDGFIKNRSAQKAKEAQTVNAIRSVFKEIAALLADIAKTSPNVETLPVARAELAALTAQSEKLQATTSTTTTIQSQLDSLSGQIASLNVEDSHLERLESQTERWEELLKNSMEEDYGVDPWTDTTPDPLKELREAYGLAVGQVFAAGESFSALLSKVRAKRQELIAKRAGLETQARALRAQIEKAVEGAGVLARQIAATTTRIAQLESLTVIIQERRQRLAVHRQRRDTLLDELEQLRKSRFDARAAVADKLNETLGPRVGVSVEQYGQFGDYTRAISDALRGSGLKYNDLSASIANLVSPRELLRYVDEGDFAGFAQATGLPRERSARTMEALREGGLGEIVTCAIEDNVRLRLLDGAEYKDVAQLSAGQRCTVVLPVILQHDDRILILDQPEDHIDNAFITETLIKSLRARSSDSQIIVSTHNANIPVLGEAALIVQMASDGRNGTIELSKPLDDPDSVTAITRLMEGGITAFQQRASFYKAHGAK